jgi:hypothetical protein
MHDEVMENDLFQQSKRWPPLLLSSVSTGTAYAPDETGAAQRLGTNAQPSHFLFLGIGPSLSNLSHMRC